jgi:hypothetical protein
VCGRTIQREPRAGDSTPDYPTTIKRSRKHLDLRGEAADRIGGIGERGAAPTADLRTLGCALRSPAGRNEIRAANSPGGALQYLVPLRSSRCDHALLIAYVITRCGQGRGGRRKNVSARLASRMKRDAASNSLRYRCRHSVSLITKSVEIRSGFGLRTKSPSSKLPISPRAPILPKIEWLAAVR